MSNSPWNAPLGRRRLLALGGGALAAGALGGIGFGSGIGAANRATRRAVRRPASGDRPTLSASGTTATARRACRRRWRVRRRLPRRQRRGRVVPGRLRQHGHRGAAHRRGPGRVRVRQRAEPRHDQAGQVVPLDGILGDAESDFNERDDQAAHLRRPPVGRAADHRHVLPRLPQEPARGGRHRAAGDLDDLIAAAAALTTGDHAGLFLGNDGGIGPMGGLSCGRPAPTTSPTDNQFGFATDAVYASFAKLQRAVPERLAAARRADRLERPRGVHQRADGDPAHRPVDVPGDPGVGRSATTSTCCRGRRSTRRRALHRCRSARTRRWSASTSADVEAAKAFVQVAVGRPDRLPARVRPRLRLPHPGPQQPRRRRPRSLKSGPARQRPAAYQQYAFTQNPILWTPASGKAYSDARARMITEGADPAEEIAEVQDVVDSELDRVASGARRRRRPRRRAGTAPATHRLTPDRSSGPG